MAYIISGVTDLIVRRTSSAISYASFLWANSSTCEPMSITENVVHWLSFSPSLSVNTLHSGISSLLQVPKVSVPSLVPVNNGECPPWVLCSAREWGVSGNMLCNHTQCVCSNNHDFGSLNCFSTKPTLHPFVYASGPWLYGFPMYKNPNYTLHIHTMSVSR